MSTKYWSFRDQLGCEMFVTEYVPGESAQDMMEWWELDLMEWRDDYHANKNYQQVVTHVELKEG